MRYQNKSNDTDNWDGRMRIVAKAAVNDSTYAQTRFSATMNFKDDKDAAVKAEQIFVNHNFGDFAVRLGRQPITFGNQGGSIMLLMAMTAHSFPTKGIDLAQP